MKNIFLINAYLKKYISNIPRNPYTYKWVIQYAYIIGLPFVPTKITLIPIVLFDNET